MSLDAGTVKGKLDLDTTSLKTGFEEAHTHAQEAGDHIREIMESIAEVATEVAGPAFAQMGQEIQSAFAGFSEGPLIGSMNLIGIAAGMMREATVDVAADFHKIGLEAQRAGVSSEFLGKLAAVGKTVDLPLERISQAFNLIEQRAEAAGSGTDEKATAAFKRLGISVQELGQLADDPERLFEAVQAGMDRLGNAEERATITHQLFGRAGKELIPIFEMSREEFDKNVESIEGLEGSATAANVRIANSFNKLQVEVGAAFHGMAVDLATPILLWIDTHKDEIEADIKKVASAVKDDLGGAFAYLKSNQAEIKSGLEAIWDDMKAAVPIIEGVARALGITSENMKAIVGKPNSGSITTGGVITGALDTVLPGHNFSSGVLSPNIAGPSPKEIDELKSLNPDQRRERIQDEDKVNKAVQDYFNSTVEISTNHVNPALDQLAERIRRTTDAFDASTSRSTGNSASSEAPSQAAGVVQHIAVSVAYDPDQSSRQFAQRVMPTLRQLKSRLDDQMAGSALQKMAEMSMGGDA
jgi:DNA-binding ferritin-like protein